LAGPFFLHKSQPKTFEIWALRQQRPLEFGHFGRADLPETAWIGAAGCGSHYSLADRGNPERIAIPQPRVARNELPWVGVTQSLAKILVHTVFSTKERRPFLRDKALRDQLHRYMGGILIHLECQPVIVGGVEDHVHFLCALSRTSDAAAMVKEVKRGSSLWIKTADPGFNDFAWQNGYGIFSIGFSQIEAVRKYIAGQQGHHVKVSFQDEFRELLRRYKLEFDERYVWD
jgi:REP element-mobilizing transposase RayT